MCLFLSFVLENKNNTENTMFKKPKSNILTNVVLEKLFSKSIFKTAF